MPAEDMIGNQGMACASSLQTLDMFRASVGAAACGIRLARSTKVCYMPNHANNSASHSPGIS